MYLYLCLSILYYEQDKADIVIIIWKNIDSDTNLFFRLLIFVLLNFILTQFVYGIKSFFIVHFRWRELFSMNSESSDTAIMLTPHSRTHTDRRIPDILHLHILFISNSFTLCKWMGMTHDHTHNNEKNDANNKFNIDDGMRHALNSVLVCRTIMHCSVPATAKSNYLKDAWARDTTTAREKKTPETTRRPHK